MELLFNENELNNVRNMIKGGTIRALVIFQNEDGVVQKVVGSEQEAALWIKNNEPKDDFKYSSVLVNLVDIIDNRGHIYV